ncbi:DUF2184 domain-containing protein [Pseudochelatococcus contaminans]|uniref:DUF2184 domain-containing protein n=1 Tax=Pseudochelatococcus contaminans TaxID=1538103 RepID=A0A7W6EFH8_9HYPH|nr:DUF2184 domain-containing protein [Pseudochelatococcus contaminans]MBB3808760.1 hypothetical protein [Pseudochelatococcus contaminans]
MTFNSRDLAGTTALVKSPAILRPSLYTRDAFTTFDQATYDSAGAFLIGELERLDPVVHEPLIATTWERDIDLRTDVQIGDTSTSYTLSTFASNGGVVPDGIAWAGAETTTLPRIQLDISKISAPLTLWASEVAYTVPELESARLTGRPIDVQMLAGLNRKHQMDLDQVAYVGSSDIGATGLLNSTHVTNSSNVANGAAGTATWKTKTADEIRKDVNELLISVWAASGYTSPPTKLLVAPEPFGYISTTIASSAANTTILAFLKENNILTAERGIPLEINSVKWLDKALLPGASTDRMVAYSQRPEFVRFPIVPLQPVAPQYQGIWVKVPYYGRIGQVEVVYPETVGYRSGV